MTKFNQIVLQPVPFGELSKMAAWRAGSEKVQSMHIAEAQRIILNYCCSLDVIINKLTGYDDRNCK